MVVVAAKEEAPDSKGDAAALGAGARAAAAAMAFGGNEGHDDEGRIC